jgi:microcystin degradation protein MlrC
MEAVPLLHLNIGSGGPIGADMLRGFIAELLAALRAAAPVDGVLLGLHGSFAAAGVDDADGEVMEAVRRAVGPGVPIMAALDQHCNISSLMVDSADVLSVMRTYPHTDGAERALRSAPPRRLRPRGSWLRM